MREFHRKLNRVGGLLVSSYLVSDTVLKKRNVSIRVRRLPLQFSVWLRLYGNNPIEWINAISSLEIKRTSFLIL